MFWVNLDIKKKSTLDQNDQNMRVKKYLCSKTLHTDLKSWYTKHNKGLNELMDDFN